MSRVALVTSAGKGLGHAMVMALAQNGWDVCFTYGKSQTSAQALERDVIALGRRALSLQCDLFDQAAVLETVAIAKGTFAHVDALVHSFGPFVFERTALADYDDDMWRRVLDGNLTSFFWLYRELVQEMRTRRFGRFVTLGYEGVGSARGWRYRSAYAAAKAGLVSLTRTVAREERDYGITANMVCPGDIRGQNKMRAFADVRGEVTESGLRPPVGEDVGRTVAWLCHPDSQEINGTVMEVTGAREVVAEDDMRAKKQAEN